jgi:L-lactate dehydrogenase complex protein LldF
VCPVKINIPEILLHLRKRVVDLGLSPLGERFVMKGAAAVFASATTFAAAQVAGRLAQIPFVRGGLFRNLPGPLSGWTKTRDLRALPAQSFREWWTSR